MFIGIYEDNFGNSYHGIGGDIETVLLDIHAICDDKEVNIDQCKFYQAEEIKVTKEVKFIIS